MSKKDYKKSVVQYLLDHANESIKRDELYLLLYKHRNKKTIRKTTK